MRTARRAGTPATAALGREDLAIVARDPGGNGGRWGMAKDRRRVRLNPDAGRAATVRFGTVALAAATYSPSTNASSARAIPRCGRSKASVGRDRKVGGVR